MAHRRFRGGRGGPRRSTNWIAASTNGVIVDHGVTTLISTTIISAPASDGFTVARIVGTVWAAPTVINVDGVTYMGIYNRVSGSAGEQLVLDPSFGGDIESESWMWWTAFVQVGGAAGGNTHSPQQMQLDIKVKRKLHPGDSIVLAIRNTGVVFSSAVNLRSLIMPT